MRNDGREEQPARPGVERGPVGRRRFRTPAGTVVMLYKALLGSAELAVGVILALPNVDIVAIFHRLAASELREDPGDRFVAFVSRHLPSLVQHRISVAVLLILLGLAKLTAAAAMWFGKEWGLLLLAAIVGAALPIDVRAAVLHPATERALFVVANVAALAVVCWMILHERRRRRGEAAGGSTP